MTPGCEKGSRVSQESGVTGHHQGNWTEDKDSMWKESRGKNHKEMELKP